MNLPAPRAVPPKEVIEAFASAARTTLEELAQIESWVDDSDSGLLESNLRLPAVSASIRLVRNEPGRMTLVAPLDCAAYLAARYLPEEPKLADEIIDDVIGEFANVIAGQAKTMLKGTPFHFTMSPPAVERPISLDSLAQGPAAPVISLASDRGKLLILLDLPLCPGA